MLVSAGGEDDGLTAEAMVACEDIGGDVGVGAADVRLATHVVDGCGDVECGFVMILV